ncbi:MAG: hypothetical protein IKU38_02490 [Clostridia bacterium]|nr:hypothetical protein [Clostridia bacterium]
MMNKKTVALVMTLVLCFACVGAYAASSKTTNDVVNVVVKPVVTPEVEETEEVVTVTVVKNEETQAKIEEIAKVVESGAPVVEYFGEETVLAVKEEIGEKAADLKMDEFISVVVNEPVKAGKQLTIQSASTYTEKDTVVVIASAVVNGQKVNKVVTYKIVDGKLVIDITEELAALLEAGLVDFAILSDLGV